MSKVEILKLIESRIEAMQNLVIESIELIYNAGYNEGIEAAAKEAEVEEFTFNVRKLKK